MIKVYIFGFLALASILGAFLAYIHYKFCNMGVQKVRQFMWVEIAFAFIFFSLFLHYAGI